MAGREYPYPTQCLHSDENPVAIALRDFVSRLSEPSRLSPNDWIRFYKFIIVSYENSSGNRFRISELSDILRESGIPNPGTLAVTYAHCLYVLAMREGLQIFREGFNP